MIRPMHRMSLAVAATLLAACTDQGATQGPPLDRLYFPSGIVHVDAPGTTDGVLFVANANLNKRYGTGSLVALSLDALGLPALGAPATAVAELKNLALTESQSVQIATFAGELAAQPVGPGTYRLFSPTRSEGMRVYRTLASLGPDGTPSLSCIGAEGQNCVDTGTSLSPREFEQSDAGVPRAPSPYGVTVAPRACTTAAQCCPADAPECGRSCSGAGQCVGKDALPFADVWFTHLAQADSPLLSGLNLRAYLVRVDSDDFTVGAGNFIESSYGGTNSIVSLGDWVYASGRFVNPTPNILRVANRDGVVALSGVEGAFRVSESRGLAVSSDGKRLYLVGRIPDALITLNLDTSGAIPLVQPARSAWLPDGPNEVKVIARPGRGDLLVITATNAGSVVLYDEDVGDVVATVPSVGAQPYSIAIDARGTAARVYVSLFGDGRIAVLDIPDVNRPQGVHLVARLGEQQVCLTIGSSSPGCLASKAVPQ